MRILHVAEAFSSGILPIVSRISTELVEEGHAAGIAFGVRPETPADPSASVTPGVELFPMPWTSRSPGQQLSAARALRRLASSWRPDLIHLHSSFAGGVGALALHGRVPLVYTPHGYSFTMTDRSRLGRGALRAAERLVARRVDLVGAVSESEASLARTVARAGRVAVVRNGIADLDDPPPPRTTWPARPEVLSVGRISPPRPPGPAAEILGSLTDVADVAWLGGETKGLTGTALLREAGIPVTGWLPREEALRRVANASACLHWAAWDGLPISVLEALALDVVVVASDIPPNREILGPAQVFSEPAAAAELLRVAVTDPATREKLLRSQRERRLAFGGSRMAHEWLLRYTQLVQEHAPSADNRR